MATACRRDCAFYSTFTETCDYTLLTYRARPCPAGNCTEYRPREGVRTWQTFSERAIEANRIRKEQINAARNGAAVQRGGEPSVTAMCGHEVFRGERMYSDPGGKTLCPDCMEDVFCELALEEKARLLGYGMSGVRE